MGARDALSPIDIARIRIVLIGIKPLGVTPIPDFINEQNIEQARAQSPNPRARSASIELLSRAIAEDAEIPRRLQRIR